jgi:hypothetical protein
LWQVVLRLASRGSKSRARKIPAFMSQPAYAGVRIEWAVLNT